MEGDWTNSVFHIQSTGNGMAPTNSHFWRNLTVPVATDTSPSEGADWSCHIQTGIKMDQPHTWNLSLSLARLNLMHLDETILRLLYLWLVKDLSKQIAHIVYFPVVHTLHNAAGFSPLFFFFFLGARQIYFSLVLKTRGDSSDPRSSIIHAGTPLSPGPKYGNPVCGSPACEADLVRHDYDIKSVGQRSGSCVKVG